MKEVSITIRIEKEIKEKLIKMAKKEDRTLSNYITSQLKKLTEVKKGN